MSACCPIPSGAGPHGRAHRAGPAREAVVVVCSARALSQPVIPPEEFATALQVDPPQPTDRAPRPAGAAGRAWLRASGRGGGARQGQPSRRHRGRLPARAAASRAPGVLGRRDRSVRTFDPETQRSLNPVDSVLSAPRARRWRCAGQRRRRRLDRLDIIGLQPGRPCALGCATWRRCGHARPSTTSPSTCPICTILPPCWTTCLTWPARPARPRRAATHRRELAKQGEEVRDRLERDGENPPGCARLPAWAALAAPSRRTQAALRRPRSTDEARGPRPSRHGARARSVAPQSYGGRMRAFAQDVRKLLGDAPARRHRQRAGAAAGRGLRRRGAAGRTASCWSPPHRSARAAGARHAGARPRALPRGLAQPLAGALGLHRRRDLRLVASARRPAPRQPSRPPPSWPSCAPATTSCIRITASAASTGWSSSTSEGVEREYLLDRSTPAPTGSTCPPTSSTASPATSAWATPPPRSASSAAPSGRGPSSAPRRASATSPRELLRLYSRARGRRQGHPFPSDDEQPWQQELEEALPLRGDARPAARHRRGQGRHGARPPDGPPRLRRRRLRQDRGRAARRLQGRARPATGGRARADDRARAAALQHLQRAPASPIPVARRAARRFRSEKEQKEVAARPRARARSTSSSARIACSQKDVGFKDLGLLDHRRGAALRRRAQGAAQAAAHRGGRAHAHGHADPAHAAHGAGRASAT